MTGQTPPDDLTVACPDCAGPCEDMGRKGTNRAWGCPTCGLVWLYPQPAAAREHP